MGVLPLEYKAGENRESLGLTGHEVFEMEGISSLVTQKNPSRYAGKSENGQEKSFTVIARAAHSRRVSYYHHGGILQYVLRQML